MKTLLKVENLKTSFYTHLGEVQAVRGISFELNEGDILGIVGESGSGKSVTSLSVMGLIDEPGVIKEESSIVFDDIELTELNKREMSNLRGNEIAMIFQDPMTSLNPVYSIKNQMTEVIRKHTNMTKSEALERAIELLHMVGIPEPEIRIKGFPHQFSGGMRQRALIATALSCNPKLLIADEPTTALDVTIQAQILDLMRDLQNKLNTSIILITHDLGVIAEVCNKVVVMYGGMIMEKGTIEEIFYKPQHPYTKGLHKSIPKVNLNQKERLVPIEGSPPDLMAPPSGCPFSPRCPHAMKICIEKASPLFNISESQRSSCWLHDQNSPQVEGFVKVKGDKYE
ncbi:ABC transporter ATP-binding protein [Mycoplasmatota bacterium]|nr:ABC transporter ATP-binding protein [Mycoplasmatota bacterium]